MKKKILGIGVVAILIAMIFVLTGCGNNTKFEKNNENDEATNFINNSEKNNNKTAISIEKTTKVFNNGYAVVKGKNDKEYVINEKGEVTFELDTTGKEKFENGYILHSNSNGYDKDEDGYARYVMDGTGKVVFKEEKSKSYKAISKNGYASVNYTIEDFANGLSSEYSIEDKTGKTVFKNNSNGCSYEYVGGDVFNCEGEHTLINARTGKTYIYDENDTLKVIGGLTDGYLYFINEGKNTDYIISEDLENIHKIEEITVLGILNNQYFYGKVRNYDNDTNDYTYGIYDMNEKLIKDLTEGGIYSAFEYEDVYYIKSNTGFIYTLDSNFNYIKEPIKSHGDLLPTTKGIITSKEGEVYLLNKDLDYTDKLSLDTEFKFDTYLVSYNINKGFSYFETGKFIYSKDGIIYNLENREKLQISK